MFKTIYDVSTETAISNDPSAIIIAIVAIIVPIGSLVLWWKFRYVVMGSRKTILLGQIKLNETSGPIYNMHRAIIRNGAVAVLGLISIIGLIIATLIIVGNSKTYHKNVLALENHSATMVEGPIVQFEPFGTSPHRISKIQEPDTESFVVQGVLFVYSRNFGDGGFNGSAETSAALSTAKMARIWYVDNPVFDKKVILKLEIQ